ncbi:MAG: hypothetical protein J6N78_00370 [Clostridia bacterium]|nr:hypothetical protein [Clostridia bacterium]
MENKKEEVKQEIKRQDINKLSYEDLKSLTIQIDNAYHEKVKEVEQLKLTIESIVDWKAKLAFLFEVVKNSDKFNSTFVKDCVDEIEKSLSKPEEENK